MSKGIDEMMDALLGNEPSVIDRLLQEKAAAADTELLKVAGFLQPEDPLALYEELGGDYQKAKE